MQCRKQPPLTWWRVESRSRIVKKRNNESDWELKDGNGITETSIMMLLLLSENEAPPFFFFRQTENHDSAAFLIGRAAEARLAVRRAVVGGEGRRR